MKEKWRKKRERCFLCEDEEEIEFAATDRAVRARERDSERKKEIKRKEKTTGKRMIHSL